MTARGKTSLSTIVGLFDGNLCRRCEVRFPLLSDPDGQREHRDWHQEQDELAASASYSREDDLAYFGNLRPPAGYRPDAGRRVVRLEPPTREQLANQRANFHPGKNWADHERACDETAALFGLTGKTPLELRREGKSLGQIAELTGVPLKRVRQLVRAG
jgi:hypothetical protein